MTGRLGTRLGRGRAALAPRARSVRLGDPGEILFLVALGVWLVQAILGTSFYASGLEGLLGKAIRYGCVALLAASEVAGRRRYGRGEAAGVAVAAVICACALCAGEKGVIYVVVFAFCARGRDFRRVAALALAVTSATCLLVLLGVLAGIIPDYVSEGRERRYLGFLYALYPAKYLFLAASLWVCLRGRSFRLWDAALLAVLAAAVYAATDSRLSCALTALLALLALAAARWEGMSRRRALGVLLAGSFALAALVSVGLTAAYSPEVGWMASLDGALGGRLSLGHAALEEYGVPLLGQPIDFIGNGLRPDGTLDRSGAYNYVDCLYVKLLVRYGLVFAAAFVALMTAVARRAWASGDTALSLALAALAACCMVDDLSLQLHYDTLLLLVGSLMVADSTPAGLHRRSV